MLRLFIRLVPLFLLSFSFVARGLPADRENSPSIARELRRIGLSNSPRGTHHKSESEERLSIPKARDADARVVRFQANESVNQRPRQVSLRLVSRRKRAAARP